VSEPFSFYGVRLSARVLLSAKKITEQGKIIEIKEKHDERITHINSEISASGM
jgi:hypothetical protein